MELIIPHINTDFDALASALAASKLFPQAKLFFPGAQEHNVRDYLTRFGGLFPEIIKAKKLRARHLTKVILVDVSHAERLGEFSNLLDQPGLTILRFDHHPGPSHLKNEFHHQQAGANVSLMIRLLQAKHLEVTPDEATLLALGIYEETGHFTYTSTTAVDFEAAAWCRRQGADLTVVMDFLKHIFSTLQQALLDDLVKSRETVTVRGVPISLAIAERDSFVEDLAVIASRLKAMENLPVLMVFCRMGTRIYLVARSSRVEVAADQMVSLLGSGGGHHTAASGLVKDHSLVELKERFLKGLDRVVQAIAEVAGIMSHPVMTVTRETTVAQTQALMSRSGHSGLPVVEQSRLQGLVTRQDIEKALQHGLGSSLVGDYMNTQIKSLSPRTPLTEVQDLFLSQHFDYLPVVEKEKLIGMVTRSDVFRIMVERKNMIQLGEKIEGSNPFFFEPHHRLKDLVNERLPRRLQDILHTAGLLADQLGMNAFVVGGFVRDLIVGHENWDIDIVIEGNGLAFAQELGRKYKGKTKTHERFRTAVVNLPNGHKIDVVTSRTEFYDRPAALPRVQQASLKYDLYRRDFTINTLAMQLNHDRFGRLLDYFGGVQDLRDGLIRVLYAVSFVDDPTRIFRAVRFEQRLNFKIDPDTRRYMDHALRLDLVRKLSMPRIFDELMLILAEDQPEKAIAQLGAMGVLGWIHPQLKTTSLVLQYFDLAWECLAFAIVYLQQAVDKRTIYLMALLDGLNTKDVLNLAGRSQFPKALKELLHLQKIKGDQARRRLELMDSYRPSQVVRLLRPLPLEVLLYEMARSSKKETAQAFRQYLLHWRHVHPILSGRDLRKLGYPPGPVYEKMLTKLRNGRLDGKIASRRDEINCLQHYYPLPETRP